VVALQRGKLVGARQQRQQAIARTDGCALQGAPQGNGPSRDWITSCAAQEPVYPPLVAALAAIAPWISGNFTMAEAERIVNGIGAR
jgi:hypothetical protein